MFCFFFITLHPSFVVVVVGSSGGGGGSFFPWAIDFLLFFEMANETVWVFAYGSLIWNPGFEYKNVIVGYISGYSRRFYQGSDQHRGSPESVIYFILLILKHF